MTKPNINIPLSPSGLSDMCFGRLIRIGDLIASDTINDPRRAIKTLRHELRTLPKRYGPLHIHLYYRIEQLKQSY